MESSISTFSNTYNALVQTIQDNFPDSQCEEAPSIYNGKLNDIQGNAMLYKTIGIWYQDMVPLQQDLDSMNETIFQFPVASLHRLGISQLWTQDSFDPESKQHMWQYLRILTSLSLHIAKVNTVKNKSSPTKNIGTATGKKGIKPPPSDVYGAMQVGLPFEDHRNGNGGNGDGSGNPLAGMMNSGFFSQITKMMPPGIMGALMNTVQDFEKQSANSNVPPDPTTFVSHMMQSDHMKGAFQSITQQAQEQAGRMSGQETSEQSPLDMRQILAQMIPQQQQKQQLPVPESSLSSDPNELVLPVMLPPTHNTCIPNTMSQVD
jgi:hypothetical protein